MNSTSFQWITGFFEDAIRITDSFSNCAGNTIIDTAIDNRAAHRDAIQLIPQGSFTRSQYAGAMLSNVAIMNNHIRSHNLLQGIFCSDGLLKDIHIMDNVIETNSVHYITLNGLLSGCIVNNLDVNGVPCPILLNPLRIGGNPGTGNVWVLSFSDKLKYNYAPIGDIVDVQSLPFVIDNRTSLYSSQSADIFLTDFDLDGFIVKAQDVDHSLPTIEWCIKIQKLAISMGIPLSKGKR